MPKIGSNAPSPTLKCKSTTRQSLSWSTSKRKPPGENCFNRLYKAPRPHDEGDEGERYGAGVVWRPRILGDAQGEPFSDPEVVLDLFRKRLSC